MTRSDHHGLSIRRIPSAEKLRQVAVLTTLPVAAVWAYLLAQINWMVMLREIPEKGMYADIPADQSITAFNDTILLLMTTWYGNLTVVSAIIATGLWWLGDRVECLREMEDAQ